MGPLRTVSVVIQQSYAILTYNVHAVPLLIYAEPAEVKLLPRVPAPSEIMVLIFLWVSDECREIAVLDHFSGAGSRFESRTDQVDDPLYW
jgi:hypothetical protein